MIIPIRQQALIEIAQKFVGVHEVGNNDGPQIEIFQRIISKPMHQPWCVDFVQYCLRQVDQRFSTKNVLFPTESSQILWDKSPANARILVPEPGCIIVWQHYNGNTPMFSGHVGIVKEVDSSWLLTIEGNTSAGPGIQREGDGVYLKRRRIRVNDGPMRTLGYLLPWVS